MNPVFPVLSDKLAVRSFISARIDDDILIPLLWSGSADDIPFDQLRPPYVLKSTHASGHYLMIDSDDMVQPGRLRDEIRAKAREWLSSPFGITQDEPGYVPVPPRMMAERTIIADNGERPNEVRLFVFNGKVGAINTVFVEDGQIRNGAFHSRDWTLLGWYFSRAVERPFPAPRRLADMIRIAEHLGRDLDQVRVDFYDCGDRIYIGELTLYSWAGMSAFNPDSADFELGAHWKLRFPLLRAIWMVLFDRREIKPA
jgi:hypothetical protein